MKHIGIVFQRFECLNPLKMCSDVSLIWAHRCCEEYIKENAILQKLDFSDWAQDPGFPKFRIPDFSCLTFNIVVFARFCPDMLENHCKYCYFWAMVSKNLVNIIVWVRFRPEMLEHHCKYCYFRATVSKNLVNIVIFARYRPNMLETHCKYCFPYMLHALFLPGHQEVRWV